MQKLTKLNFFPLLFSCSTAFIFFWTVPSLSQADAAFQKWLNNFYQTAAEHGISRTTFDRTFKNVTSPDPKVIEKANYQPEFTTEIWDYLDTRVTSQATNLGRKKEAQYRNVLSEIEKKFGVERSIILAIWSMESNYGAVLAKTNRLHYVPRALATLAYKDKKRAKFARNQLIALLEMVEKGEVQPEQLMGSWAGAMGHTQFIPTSYKAYGVNMDSSPGVDIWTSVPDALGTAANLLSENGWQTGKTWGYEVIVPKGASRYKEETKTIGQWKNLGLIRPDNQFFPRPTEKAILKMTGGDNGPGFLVIKNFFVIKKYNNSDFYALAVGLLADRIAGHSPMSQKWPRPATSLNSAEKYELQLLLKALGYYQGEIDGNLGTLSRKAVKQFQLAKGRKATGVPTREILQLLRKQ